MSNFLKLKQYLKELALQIRKNRVDLKKTQKENCGYDNGLFKIIKKLAVDYRNHHIAYSLLKGRSYEQIEKKCHENNKPNMSYIQEIKNAYSENVCSCTQ